MTNNHLIPVIDLFAGPGGLGEGFSAFETEKNKRAFRICLSIEKDEAAHRTLELRSFYRQFPPGAVPDEYYLHIQNHITREELFSRYPDEHAAAAKEAWKAELGGNVHEDEVNRRIREAVGDTDEWVLCGGPPCQAYSVMGRSRNGGIAEGDHRVYLYKVYLGILAAQRPPVFILENVPGLLSSKVGDTVIFRQMLEDLRHPAVAIGAKRNGTRYRIYSLVKEPVEYDLNGDPGFDPFDFVIKCEDYGIPQSRHRVILVGIREDVARKGMPILQPFGESVPARRVLKGLPRLRSGLNKIPDGEEQWLKALAGIKQSGILETMQTKEERLVAWFIGRYVKRLKGMRADRGGEFVPWQIKSDYASEWFCDSRIGGVCNHVTRNHMLEDLYRYLFAATFARIYGRSPALRDFPRRLLPKHKNISDRKKRDYFDDRFRVQMPDKPSTTITCHIAKDGHYYIHYDPTQARSLTVREAARLQTFPDNYFFCGNRTSQYTQVGNAVPPLLARQIASVIHRIIKRAK
jgi:DNA (cytosine-5)-methyltransferase 1